VTAARPINKISTDPEPKLSAPPRYRIGAEWRDYGRPSLQPTLRSWGRHDWQRATDSKSAWTNGPCLTTSVDRPTLDPADYDNPNN